MDEDEQDLALTFDRIAINKVRVKIAFSATIVVRDGDVQNAERLRQLIEKQVKTGLAADFRLNNGGQADRLSRALGGQISKDDEFQVSAVFDLNVVSSNSDVSPLDHVMNVRIYDQFKRETKRPDSRANAEFFGNDIHVKNRADGRECLLLHEIGHLLGLPQYMSGLADRIAFYGRWPGPLNYFKHLYKLMWIVMAQIKMDIEGLNEELHTP